MVNNALVEGFDSISRQLEALLKSSKEHIATSTNSDGTSVELSQRIFNNQLKKKRLLSFRGARSDN